MLREMSWPQFYMWTKYYELEPFGEERADLRVATTTAAIYNVNRDTSRRPEPYEARDVVLRFGVKSSRGGKSGKSDVHTSRGWGSMVARFKDRIRELGVKGKPLDSPPTAGDGDISKYEVRD